MEVGVAGARWWRGDRGAQGRAFNIGPTGRGCIAPNGPSVPDQRVGRVRTGCTTAQRGDEHTHPEPGAQSLHLRTRTSGTSRTISPIIGTGAVSA